MSAPTLDLPIPADLDLAIIIVSYKTPYLACDAVRAVLDSRTDFSYHVYLIDNGSHDDSAAIWDAAFGGESRVTWRISPVNTGFASGNNQILRVLCPSTTDPTQVCRPLARHVVLLNPDTLVQPDALQKTYDYMQATPDVGVVGPKLVKADGTLDLACRRSFPSPEVSLWRMTFLSKFFPRSRRFARYNLTYLDPDQTADVDSVSGAYMMVRGAALAQVGLLDERYFMYGEDLDWAFRIKARGWRVVYYPAAIVTHLKGQSSKQRSTGAIHNFYDAMHIFYRKHYAAQYPAVVNALIYGAIWARCGLALAVNATKPKDQRRVS